ncbi:proprotein convertase P-domain-containing protein [Lewinella sp. IMCC34191]|uniref:proprotein convertase P-domain-containing protein n=1 Tax=Lewinella sp. IMCC34191 TaxID=2259172 RepID=UPI000E2671F3|nr:proprotein convertase P-domain-containing protein [Lewinella sp. IMCC34191]
MIRTAVLAWLGVLFFTSGLGAQQGMSRIQFAKLPLLSLPAMNNDSLLAAELPLRKPGRPQTFAVSLPVHLSPQTDGQWTQRADQYLWRMRVKSPGAKSLNLGFSRFVLPPGAALYLTNDTQRYGPFTAADNEDHAQLWTPLLRGDEVMLELEVPQRSKDAVELVLSTVNHDFEGAIDLLSGDCHIDVACGAADGFPRVDDYRDIIRSVAAYTLEGRAKCTGFLVNNGNQDGRPLFLTANHCGVDEETAPTMVTYWNFENDVCRAPGSAESGAEGNGRLEVFNTGARLLASHSGTDMTLVELDEPVNPRARAYFAGWDARSGLPEGVLTIHHPNLDEKRISFSDQPITRSTIVGEESATGKFLRVPSWDLGSTEGGSSGAPLFDADGRVRGQLFGGRASCSNEEEDMFGWLYASWTGGGSPDSRLMDWLDPCGNTSGILPGLDELSLNGMLISSQGCQQICSGGEATFEFTLGNDFPEASSLTVSGDPALSISMPEAVDGGGSFSLSVAASTAAAGTYSIEVTAEGDEREDALTVVLQVADDTPPALVDLSPQNNSTGIDPFVELAWEADPEAESYELQYALSSDFTALVADFTQLTATTYRPDYPLPGDTRYYWRVRARNACGAGPWSDVRSFTTDIRTCLLKRGEALPVPIPAADPSEVVAELEITDDINPANLEVIVGIEHSFVGDLSVSLVGPSGEEVKLFAPLDNGSCPASNVYATFTATASLTADAFSERCEDGNDQDYLRVQPLESLEGFTDRNARGVWKLVVNDEAAMDGGAITEFRLRLCENRADRRDLAVELLSDPITACANEGGTARLRIGSAFSDGIALHMEAGSLPLDNYTYSYDTESREVDVTFTAWTYAGDGAQELIFTVLDDDGAEGRALNTLTVLPLPEPVTPIRARVREERITFQWRGSDIADTYTLEVSPTDTFDDPVLATTTRNRQITLSRSDLPDLFYWRVQTNNDCGSFPGPSRAISADTANATYTLRADQQIAIFPNPTIGDVRIALEGEWDDPRVGARLLGTGGQEVKRWPDLQTLGYQLQLSDLPAGVYFLQLTGSFGRITERLLILR